LPGLPGLPHFLFLHLRFCNFTFAFPLFASRNANCGAIPLLASREYDEGSFQL
jgi:hypothetical protein